MKFGSLFSGIEAVSQAWMPLGWEPQFYSEIDAFPCALLAHHHPEVPNYGDVTAHRAWPRHPALDVLVGGSPCQSFSVAGLRKGLDDPRGNLMLVYLAVVERERPPWVVWENVPGVLSNNKGRSFAALLGGLGQLGYGFAYRVLDAQYFGVAQRRRRVFVVASTRGWRAAAAVLFERQSLRGDPPPSREAGQGAAASLTAGSAAGGHTPGRRREDDVNLVAKALRTSSGGIDREDGHTLIPETVGALCDGAHMGGGLNGQDAYSGRIIPVPFAQNQRDEVRELEVAGALAAEPGMKQQTYLAQALHMRGRDGGNMPELSDLTNLRASSGGSSRAMALQSTVRRLTPKECERLQGFPDLHTLIPYGPRRRPAKDGPRYKALGNSMAVPVMRWLGERIELVEEICNGR